MTSQDGCWAVVGEELDLPPHVASVLGLNVGARMRLEPNGDGLLLRRPVTHLAKVYIEATSRCNLNCRMCVRSNWHEPAGDMSMVTYTTVIEGLRGCVSPPTIFFGGFGEPLANDHIVEMVVQAKDIGSKVELITNGTLLTGEMSRALIDAGLDMLWVSLDGATPESYADVRLGAALPQVLNNITRFRDARRPSHRPTPQIGVAFVAMRRNINDLPALLRLGGRLGVTRYLVTNLLPYTREMLPETLYKRSLNNITFLKSPWVPQLSLPRMDIDGVTYDALYQALRSNVNVSLADSNLGGTTDRCPFVDGGATAVGWDGSLSPCLPLLHDHETFIGERPRFSRRYAVGNVREQSLLDLWRSPAYVAFRERVQAFDFSPCTFCGGCDYSETNEEDCFGNEFPTCGGCLWAQGVIRCP